MKNNPGLDINPRPEPNEGTPKRKSIHGEDLPRHESYGLIQISRVQGSMDLYGSPIRPHHFITLTISEASERFNLGTEWKHEGKTVVEVAMTELQFAEAITTMNHSPGTPVTLRYSRDGEGLKRYECPPRQESAASRTRDEFKAEVTDRMATMKSVKRRIDTLMEEGSLSKTRRMEIGGEIDRLLGLFTDSAPFFLERFEENAEKVVATAKAEISAHAEQVLRVTGVAALSRGDVPLIEGPKQA